MTPEKIAHFKSKLVQSGDCLLFNGKLNKAGNAQFAWVPYSVNPNGSKMKLVHHIAWFLSRGEFPNGRTIQQTCGKNHCCNPDHLYIGKQGQNPNKTHGNKVPIEDRFWSKVDKKGPDECWEWKAMKITGYGRVRFRGKTEVSSRVAWVLTNGEIPDGLYTCHKCDNPGCCNPNHLFLGTPKDNTQDCFKKGRYPIRRGEKVNTSKLKPEDVMEIRNTYTSNQSRKTVGFLSRKFSIKRETVYCIIYRQTWKHVP